MPDQHCRWIRLIVYATLTCAAIFVLFPIITAAQSLDATCLIAFSSKSDDNQEIYVVRDDGSELTNLTNSPANDRFLTWSPDGTQIAFASDRGGVTGLYIMNADGSDIKAVVQQAIGRVEWSPDGSHLVFDASPNGDGDDEEIFTLRPDGSDLQQLTDNDVHDIQPVWSPNGSKIAFNRFAVRTPSSTYIINSDGTSEYAIPGTGETGFSDWSSDGSEILFLRVVSRKAEIFRANADGSNQVNLSRNKAFDAYAFWQPTAAVDDALILFGRKDNGRFRLFTMNTDGSNQRLLSPELGDYFPISWSPDGTRFLFQRILGPGDDLYTMEANGSNLQRLTQTYASEGNARWSPACAR